MTWKASFRKCNRNLKTSMKQNCFWIIFTLFILCSCEKLGINSECKEGDEVESIDERQFEMGFSTWSFGPGSQDREKTYDFIFENGDIYSEQVDDRIPWTAWINDEPLPEEFVDDINFRVSQADQSKQMILSVSLLNTGRDDIIEDWNGESISYSTISDLEIEDAYFSHLCYLIDRFNPDYLVAVMEANDLLINGSQQKWIEYQLLMDKIRPRIRSKYPDLKISESITLHNFYNPEVDNPDDFIEELSAYMSKSDFAAISFYPFFKGLHSKRDFQKAFDFLHEQVNLPIAFIETTHLPEDLSISSFDLNIKSDECEQKDYLEILLKNADDHNYDFIIWWAHKDFDKLWDTFPEEVKDIGKLWRDTGLIDEDGNERAAFSTWKDAFRK